MGLITKQSEVDAMREAGRIVALAHSAVVGAVAPGITSRELDAIVERVIVSEGGRPAFKGYHGFPASICASVNDEVVHGIPNRRRLESGDIISVDIGAVVDGFYGDSAWTYAVGEVDEIARQLLETTEASLYAGIRAAIAGAHLNGIGSAVQSVVDEKGFSVVRDFVGHGIGKNLHESPQVANYRQPEPGPVLRPGEALAIEPMVNVGGHAVKTKKNGWTVVTLDGSWSAHFEHTIIVSEGDALITTSLNG